ncbi:MAG: hypothetical protein NZ580_07295 [Bacteroidia bacterium]|nr:hypothetical protein [Bacteroidia bacterium]MDW8236631.1 hypothetical protein [Bacteroidia bacterium]
MQRSAWLTALLGVVVIGGVVGLYALHRENQALHQEVERLSHIIAERPVELSTFMASYERFATKLYQAGHAQNWSLAAFYAEELKETAEQLERLNISEEGIPISRMMETNLIQPVEAVEKAIAQQDKKAFEQSFTQLIMHCNNCHAAVGKPYIQFSVREVGLPLQQNFQPKGR